MTDKCPGHARLIAFDPSYLSKRGKRMPGMATFGLAVQRGRSEFWNGAVLRRWTYRPTQRCTI
ncbi:MAG: hypothetical protein NZM43_04080 [Saprospiraceae bacterium]|nr:hypothetical protein [Saprospiraceae bacterium]MDW8483485.1 hypothetical protein [Saprospiraceae bacterium]